MKDLPTHPGFKKEQVHTALLLAAGTGSRLAPLTDKTPKCLVPVNEISILERLVDALRLHNFKRLVIVVGHQADSIRNFLGTRAGGMEITYITSPVYKTTNNIYSLWLARKEIDEPFLLIESDLVFDPEMLTDMLQPDRIAVSKLQPWMNGTTVTINRYQKIKAFQKDIQKPDDNHYKTVNIYSLSTLTWQLVCKRLDHHISNNMVNGYYETVFADMVTEECLSFTPVFFDADRWYEIDTIADLRAAAQVCSRHHLPFALIHDHQGSDQIDLGFLQASRRLPAIARSKRGSRRYPNRKVVAPMMPASLLAPQSI
ncbi:MAG: phosphocholine cytidylyltransferase family protein [Deltaproteobacteria bacterium]|nr:phosphocholine cytidylyltransferase family protein [Deltaproteobacteria bacterium]